MTVRYARHSIYRRGRISKAFRSSSSDFFLDNGQCVLSFHHTHK